jgi:SAM-dependent methyltransferase
LRLFSRNEITCERLVKYHNNSIEVSGVNISNITLGKFGIESKLLQAASHALMLLDAYQYHTCLSIRNIEEKEKRQKYAEKITDANLRAGGIIHALAALSFSPNSRELQETVKERLLSNLIPSTPKAIAIDKEMLENRDLFDQIQHYPISEITGKSSFQEKMEDLKQLYPEINQMKILSDNRSKYRKPVSTIIELMTKEVLDRLDTDDGVALDGKEVEEVYKSCFADADIYYGTDTNIPSKFVANMPLFKLHMEKQVKNKKQKTGRILIVSEEDLKYDFQVNYPKFLDCYRMHRDHNITLYQVDRADAVQFAKRNKLPDDVIEVGIWEGKYAIQWFPLKDERRNFSFGYAEDGNRYPRCIDYYNSLMSNSKVINITVQKNDEGQEIRKLELVPVNTSRSQNGLYVWKEPIHTALDNRDLVPIWKDFVNCKKRIKRMGAFLSSILEKHLCTNVLDAAAGVGCETVYLAKKRKYIVTSNESSEQLLHIAQEYARKNYVEDDVTWTPYDWRVMASEFRVRQFDAVLVLGNFISLIHDDEDKKRCLDQFYKILKQGGILIIDLRNYEKISENPTVVGNAKLFYGNSYSGEFTYTGDEVKGWPVKVDDGRKIVTFRYAKNASSSPNAEIQLCMVKRKELEKMLDDVNFEILNLYSNFRRGYSKNADFFTYVAEKPRERRLES